jgi:hypothetical protein
MCSYDSLLAADPRGLSSRALSEALVAVEALLRRAAAAQAGLVAEFDERGLADAAGSPSTAAWLREHTGVAERDAHATVFLARTLRRLPLLASALADGSVTVAHVRLLAARTRRLPDPLVRASERLLVHGARTLDPDRYRTFLTHWAAVATPAAYESDTERRYDSRWLTLHTTYDGMGSLQGMLDPEATHLLRGALDALVHTNPPDDPRTRDQQRADALTDLVGLAHTHDLIPTTGAHRPEIVVHLPANGAPATRTATAHGAATATGTRAAAATSPADPALTDSATDAATRPTDPALSAPSVRATGATAAVLDGVGPLTPAAFDRLACDATWRRLLLDRDTLPVALGRATRAVPASLRKLVALRDRHCRYPGCTRRPAYCEAHHVTHWAHGGTTDAANLVLLCRYHHHLVHDRAHALTLHADATVTVHRPDGTILTSRARGPTLAQPA